MNIAKKIAELKEAYQQGFFSENDFNERMILLSENEESSKTNGIQDWVSSLFTNAIKSCSTEQDRIAIISWLTLSREVLNNEELSITDKTKALYELFDSKSLAKGLLRSVEESFANYKNSDLPLAIKIAIPVTLGAGAIVGGAGVELQVLVQRLAFRFYWLFF